MFQIIFHTVLCAAILHRAQVWCQLARFRKHNQVRISLHIFLVTVISESQVGLELQQQDMFRWLLCANSSCSLKEVYILLCTRVLISQRISFQFKLWEALELNDKEVSNYSRSHTDKQPKSDILIMFLMKHVAPCKYIDRNRNLIKSVTDVIFVGL